MLSLSSFSNENFVIGAIVFLTGIQIILSCLESIYDGYTYRPTQWLSWQHIRAAKKVFSGNTWVNRRLDYIFEYPTILLLFWLRLSASLYLIWLITHNSPYHQFTGLILVITILGVLIVLRNTFSNNGADQLANIILIAVSISTLEGEGSVIKTLSLIFIACQSQLSYLTSGFFKLLEKDWRNGTSLKGIFSTEVFGHPLLKKVMDRWPSSYKVASAGVIYGELALGCSMFFPPKITLVLLATGALFHFLTAIIMGLNAFFWVFVATYPAVYFLSLRIHA